MKATQPGDQIQVFGIEAKGPDEVGLVQLSSAIALVVE